MSVKARSEKHDLDLTPGLGGTQSTPKNRTPKRKLSRMRSKNTKSAGSIKTKARTTGTDTHVRPFESKPSSIDVDSGDASENATGQFNDYTIGGPSSSQNAGGMTRRATLPSAPLVSTTTEPLFGTSQGQYYLFCVSSPVQSLVKSKLPLDFEKFSNISIGRDSSNILMIPDQVISRLHAELIMQDGRVYLKDLGSTNGTFIYDGAEFQQIQDKVEVLPNSVVRLGSHTIVKLIRE